MAKLLRKKAKVMEAFGSCAHTGGVPGLANLSTREELLKTVYQTSPSTVNPDGVLPQEKVETKEGVLTLPRLHEFVKPLDQVVDVDYYLPGCPPPSKLVVEAGNS